MILLTGGTGFLGTHLVRELLHLRLPIAVLVRAPADEAVNRLARAWWDWPDLAALIGTTIHACAGDLTKPGMGLGHDDLELLRATTHVVHAAAEVSLQSPLAQVRGVNRDGTARVLELARTFPSLKRILHVSTAYVAGNRPGPVREDDLDGESGFRNGYELTKFEGELLVRDAMASLPVTVARPGMVVGDSRTGAITTFNTFYFPLRLYFQGNLRLIPVRPSLRLPLVPVDYVARSIAALLNDPRAVGSTVHLVPPQEHCPTVGNLIRFVRAWAESHLSVRLPRPLFLPIPVVHRWRTYRPGDPPRGALRALLPYSTEVFFRRDTADRLLGPYDIDWRTMLPVLLSYAIRHGFMHRSERTVHEQVAFRLSRPSRPIRYHDVLDGTLESRPAQEMADDIRAARRSLHALGIRQGDRVAIVGPNCSRYLIVDVALGLVGAVSVPLYPTTPPAELRRLIGANDVRLVFVGGNIVRELGGDAGVRLISFGRDPLGEPGIMTWKAFLRAGEGTVAPRILVHPDDPATLRHTSGTTGGPHAVVFDHRNLRWMAECLASLLPWPSRIRTARYLSWLPMSHVVEGILATYAPYYLPAPVDIYFLEDFHQLPRALRVARPTAFFSVPRFYEKLWAAFTARPVARLLLAHRQSPCAGLVRPLLRRGLLRAAGLHRCASLIVGSAPSDTALLTSFREMGIEIHDAYGLTEAPLVTLNRPGANRIGTVGPPLPETELAIVEGEVTVQGPQVARGAHVDPGGWLHTGDLGHLTPEGYLVLEGRRRDIVATAYGKKVAVGAVEAALRAIPGVEEAMVVGECRPCCVALLWVRRDLPEVVCEEIDRGVHALNARLLPPERVRRWALIEGSLSPASGELTPNLKLRRGVVAQQYAAVVEGLYEGAPLPGVRHVGSANPQVECP